MCFWSTLCVCACVNFFSSFSILFFFELQILPEMGYQLLQNYAEQVRNWGWICSIHSQNSRSFKRQVGFVSRKLRIEFSVHQEHRVWGSLSVRIPLKWCQYLYIIYANAEILYLLFTCRNLNLLHKKPSVATLVAVRRQLFPFFWKEKKSLLTSIQYILQAEIGFSWTGSVLILYAKKIKIKK